MSVKMIRALLLLPLVVQLCLVHVESFLIERNVFISNYERTPASISVNPMRPKTIKVQEQQSQKLQQRRPSQHGRSQRQKQQLSMMNIRNVIATALHHDPDDHHVMMAGSIWPILQKLVSAPMKFRLIVHNIVSITEWQECILLPILAFGITPLAKLYYNTFVKKQDSSYRNMNAMKRFGVIAFIDQISKVALSVYVMDVISITLTTIGFTFAKQWRIAEVYAKLAYTIYAVERFLLYKKLALCKYFQVDSDSMGRVELINHVLNGAIVSITTLLFLDWMSIEMNKALTGLVAFGSAGTLAFTLASKDIVEQLISGFFLIFGNKMYVGDSVVFGDGTSGKVMKIGWLETLLRDSNNVITRVPNTLLSSQKVSNLSRIAQSQVKQTLRFGYKDALILPALLEEVKAEIRATCPQLITDKSRPFRAFWTDYKEDHLEVMIDTHFNIPPFSDAYWLNRQNVLIAITKAITKYNVQLIPADNSSSDPLATEMRQPIILREEKRATMDINDSDESNESETNGTNGEGRPMKK